MTLYSYQAFAEVGRPCDNPEIRAQFPETLEDYEIDEKVTLTPGDGICRIPSHETGCFISGCPSPSSWNLIRPSWCRMIG